MLLSSGLSECWKSLYLSRCKLKQFAGTTPSQVWVTLNIWHLDDSDGIYLSNKKRKREEGKGESGKGNRNSIIDNCYDRNEYTAIIETANF